MGGQELLLGVECFSAAERSASESLGSSTARASTSAPTMVDRVASAC